MFHYGLLSFTCFFCASLTPGGSGNKVFQNIKGQMNIFWGVRSCCVSLQFLHFVTFFLYVVVVIGFNLSKYVVD